MASKFAKFLPTLEKREPEDGGFQAKVDARKITIGAKVKGAEALARRWRRVRGVLDKIAQRESKMNVELKATFQLMLEAYEAAGITKLDFKEGGAVGTEPAIYVGFKTKERVAELIADGADPKAAKEQAGAEARAKLRAWAVENGHGNDLTINPATMAAIFREMMVEGQPIPDFISITTDTNGKLYQPR